MRTPSIVVVVGGYDIPMQVYDMPLEVYVIFHHGDKEHLGGGGEAGCAGPGGMKLILPARLPACLPACCAPLFLQVFL